MPPPTITGLTRITRADGTVFVNVMYDAGDDECQPLVDDWHTRYTQGQLDAMVVAVHQPLPEIQALQERREKLIAKNARGFPKDITFERIMTEFGHYTVDSHHGNDFVLSYTDHEVCLMNMPISNILLEANRLPSESTFSNPRVNKACQEVLGSFKHLAKTHYPAYSIPQIFNKAVFDVEYREFLDETNRTSSCCMRLMSCNL